MKKNLPAAVLIGVIALALGWLIYSQFGHTEKVSTDVYETLGSITADETAKLLGEKGEVVVISWDSKMAVDQAQVDSFQRALKKHKEMKLAGSEKVARNPAQMMSTGGAIPAEQFLKVVKSHPQASAIVSFLAFPRLTTQDVLELSRTKTKFIVVSGCNPGYKKLLLERVITLGIFPKVDRSENLQPPKTIRENFDQNYTVVSFDQAASLPY